MPKISSYIKAIIPSQKSIARLPHWQNYLPISPKDQSDISSIVIPKVGANSWNANGTDLEYLQKMYDCHDLVHSCIDLVSSTFALAKLRVKKLNPKTQNAAFKQLVQQYQKPLYFHIRNIVLNHDDADDVLQNTFIKVFSNLKNFKGESKLYSWMYRIATNESLK